MSKEQICEIATILKEYTKKNNIMASHVILEDYAKEIYNANYRKQSEGEWIRKDGFFVCSVCDTTKPFAVLNDNIHYFACNYCHICGAKMKGGAE